MKKLHHTDMWNVVDLKTTDKLAIVEEEMKRLKLSFLEMNEPHCDKCCEFKSVEESKIFSFGNGDITEL